MVELVDTLALGANAARREGSSPFIRTNKNRSLRRPFLIGKDPEAPALDVLLYSLFYDCTQSRQLAVPVSRPCQVMAFGSLDEDNPINVHV